MRSVTCRKPGGIDAADVLGMQKPPAQRVALRPGFVQDNLGSATAARTPPADRFAHLGQVAASGHRPFSGVDHGTGWPVFSRMSVGLIRGTSGGTCARVRDRHVSTFQPRKYIDAAIQRALCKTARQRRATDDHLPATEVRLRRRRIEQHHQDGRYVCEKVTRWTLTSRWSADKAGIDLF